jgi:NAD(P)H-nitrite reductase large subunit
VPADAARKRRRFGHFADAVRKMLEVPEGAWQAATDDTIVCRCENVTCAEIASAVADGHRTPNAVKRNTRAAMGWCGGRMCLHSIDALILRLTHEGADTAMTPRPMVRPVTFASLANHRTEEEPG